MNYKIKVGNKFLVGESVSETLKGTTRGDTTAVYSRYVGEMIAYVFCDEIEDAEPFDRVTASDYVRGIMERQNCGLYLGEIKLIDADAEETVAHCNVEQNARIIAHIMEFDSQNMVYDWYEQHIQQAVEREESVQERAWLAEQIDAAHTVSPDEVRGVGTWLRKEKVRHNLDGDGDYRYECSACGHSDEHNENVHVPFCWYCGAKMEVSEDA